MAAPLVLDRARFVGHEDRFWSKVDVTPTCWLWTSATDSRSGHGRFSAQGRVYMAHRVAWTLLVGPIPADLVLDHVRARGCGVTNCVNPMHLEPVTPGTNTLRSDSPSALRARQTECHRGHPFNATNTWVEKTGYRHCRTCRRERRKSRAAA